MTYQEMQQAIEIADAIEAMAEDEVVRIYEDEQESMNVDPDFYN